MLPRYLSISELDIHKKLSADCLRETISGDVLFMRLLGMVIFKPSRFLLDVFFHENIFTSIQTRESNFRLKKE